MEHNRTFNRTGLKWLNLTQIHFINTEIESREKLEILVDTECDGDDQEQPPLAPNVGKQIGFQEEGCDNNESDDKTNISSDNDSEYNP